MIPFTFGFICQANILLRHESGKCLYITKSLVVQYYIFKILEALILLLLSVLVPYTL